MVRLAGIEPATLGLEGRCSIRLSYRRVLRLSLLRARGATSAGTAVPVRRRATAGRSSGLPMWQRRGRSGSRSASSLPGTRSSVLAPSGAARQPGRPGRCLRSCPLPRRRSCPLPRRRSCRSGSGRPHSLASSRERDFAPASKVSITTPSRFFPSRIAFALGHSARARRRSRVSTSWTVSGSAEGFARRAMATLAACSGSTPVRRFGGTTSGGGSGPSCWSRGRTEQRWLTQSPDPLAPGATAGS